MSSTTGDRRLDRLAPSDWTHVDKYPLTAATTPEKPSPVVIGVNWYAEFDHPTQDGQGHYWVARDGKLTKVRGGHCVCLKPKGARDSAARQAFYNQGNEGACVGFGVSRLATTLNGKLYFARWLWDRAKEIDEWPSTNPGDDDGTSVRAGLDVLRTKGHVPWKASYADMNDDGQAGDAYPRSGLQPVLSEGIKANRWITSIEDCLAVLGYTGLDYVDVLNSWGTDYPHIVRMPATVLERLWREDGEIGVVTDR
jgi:hypothetical protein